jgi:hypothetical protein
MDERPTHVMRRVLADATLLRDGDDLVAAVVGERIVSIVVDALLELDLEFTDPWDLLIEGRTCR